MASKTFRSAANTYFDWAKRSDTSKTVEQMLNDHVLPVIGERTMSEIWTILNGDIQELNGDIHELLPVLTGMNENDRDDTVQAVVAVIRHHLYWEAESIEI